MPSSTSSSSSSPLSVELFATGSTAPSMLEADALKASVLRMIDRQLPLMFIMVANAKILMSWM